MPDTGAPWNIPYVAASDLVKDWPTENQTLAEAIADGLDIGLGTNVVQAVKTNTFSTTSGTLVDITGLTATITPSSASSKVLIIAQVAVSGSSTNGDGPAIAIAGGNATTYVGDAAGSRPRVVSGLVQGNAYALSLQLPTMVAVYLDSPATTSATTYSVQIEAMQGTAYVNRSGTDNNSANGPRGASSITVIEVAA